MNSSTALTSHSDVQVFQAAEGLAYLHAREPIIIHGDIKAVRAIEFRDILPATDWHLKMNILIDDSGKAVLCDLGLSRIKADVTTRTTAVDVQSVFGSRNWMSPERLMGKKLRQPSDIYAMGLTIYEVKSTGFAGVPS